MKIVNECEYNKEMNEEQEKSNYEKIMKKKIKIKCVTKRLKIEDEYEDNGDRKEGRMRRK